MVVAAVLLPATCSAQTGVRSTALPATPPTSLPGPAEPLAATLDGPVSYRAERAEVTFAEGLLDVRANNSSLNAILREIARTTGMKVTGGVAEQRVFGNYGPAAPATVLATLLDGTGSNMLLREAQDAEPAELILTPRLGGPTPPSPASYTDDDSGGNNASSGYPQPGSPPPRGGSFGRHLAPGGQPGAGLGQPYPNSGQPSSAQPAVTPRSLPVPSSTSDTSAVPANSAVSGNVDEANPPRAGLSETGVQPDTTGAAGSLTPAGGTAAGGTAAAAQPDASSEPRTPEQVYQLLQQLRQRSAQQGASAPQ